MWAHNRVRYCFPLYSLIGLVASDFAGILYPSYSTLLNKPIMFFWTPIGLAFLLSAISFIWLVILATLSFVGLALVYLFYRNAY